MVTATLWSPERPDDCACGYQVRRVGRSIVREPTAAWDMLEKIHNDPHHTTLTEKMRQVCRKVYEVGFQHEGDSRKSYKGIPDLHLWPIDDIPGMKLVHVWIELKRMGGSLTEDQIAVMTSYARMDPVYLVRPCCLLSGAVDVILTRHYGGKPRSKYADGSEMRAAGGHVVRRPARSRGAKKEDELPGEELPGLALGQLVGYVVAMPVDDPAGIALYRELELWLRGAGFPPVGMAVPLRLIVGRAYLGVQLTTGLSRAGRAAPRVWRYASPNRPFPQHLVDQLGVVGVPGTGAELEELLDRDPEPAS
jgi:hypothetical protein